MYIYQNHCISAPIESMSFDTRMSIGKRAEVRRRTRYHIQYVRSITFVMYPHCQFFRRVPQECGIPKDINRLTPNRGKECFKVSSSEEFRIHSPSFYSSALSRLLVYKSYIGRDIPSKRALLSVSSDTSNLFAKPGKCHTGSMAALYVFTSIPGSLLGKAGRICDLVTIFPSTSIDPVELARSSSVILI